MDEKLERALEREYNHNIRAYFTKLALAGCDETATKTLRRAKISAGIKRARALRELAAGQE